MGHGFSRIGFYDLFKDVVSKKMMDLLNYAPFWKCEGPRREGFALGGLSKKQTQGDEIRPTGKKYLMSYRLVIMVTMMVLSQYRIMEMNKIEEQDFRSLHGR
jgi:hypothetical protein